MAPPSSPARPRAPSRRVGRALRLLPLAALVCTTFLACTDGPAAITDQAPLLSVLARVEGGPTEAFQKVDRVSLLVTAGAAVAFQETLDFSPSGEARIRIQLDPGLATSFIELSVTLQAGAAALFQGSGSVILSPTGPTTVEVNLQPVVAGVRLEDPVATLTAIGATATLSGIATFATGEGIPGVPITWTSLSPNVLSVSAGGLARALAEGEAQVRASAGSVSATGRVVVRARVVSLVVTPPSATVNVGATASFQFTARDANGNALGGRTASWRAVNGTVASVSGAGVATGLAQGTTAIEATVEGVTGSATLTVIALPAPPSGLSGQILDMVTRAYSLSWTDNANNETRFEVESRVNGGPFASAGSLPANTTTFQETGAVGTNDFRVRACNAQGCSAYSNEVRLVFLGPPTTAPSLTGRVLDERARRYQLDWTPVAGAIAYRVVQRAPNGVFFEVGSTDGSVTSLTGTGQVGENALAVAACNAFGCGPVSNVVVLVFNLGLDVETFATADVVVMRGEVLAARPYEVRFEWAYSLEDFEEGVECPCFDATSWVSGQESATWAEVVPFAYSGYTVYYRIVARNDEELVEGQIVGFRVPELQVETDLPSFAAEPDVTAYLAIPAPLSASTSPVDEVFFQYLSTNVSATVTAFSIVDESTRRLFVYETNQTIGDNVFPVEWVRANARYRTGTVVQALMACVDSDVELIHCDPDFAPLVGPRRTAPPTTPLRPVRGGPR